MSTDPPTVVASTPPSWSGRGPAGLRGSVAVAILGGAGGILGLILAAAMARFEGDEARRLAAELDEREAAGRSALRAVKVARGVVAENRDAWWDAERRASDHRAAELALFATLRTEVGTRARIKIPPSWEPKEGERIGLVDLASDRILSFTGSGEDGLIEGATLSAALPVLTGAMQSQPPRRVTPLIVRERAHVWGVGTAFAGSLYVVTRVPIPVPPEAELPLASAERAIGSLAAPTPLGTPPFGTLPWLAFGTLMGALLAGGWAHFRWTRPVNRTLDAARAFVHGEPQTRARENEGGRDARDVARAVNALIERAERLKAQGRAARGEDVTAAADAIEAFGQGDLRATTPQLGETFLPIRRALESSRRQLLDRVTSLHDVSSQVATTAADVRSGAQRVHAGATEQAEALRRLGEGADESARQMAGASDQLRAASDLLARYVDGHRRGVRAVRTSIHGVGRRLQELSTTAQRVQEVLRTSKKIDAALGLLSDLSHRLAAADAIDERTRAKVATAAGEARAGLGHMTREIESIRAELQTNGETLETVSADQPDPPGDLDGRVMEPLHYAATTLSRTAALASSGLKALERSARAMGTAAHELDSAVARTSERLPELDDAFRRIRVGASFEDALLDRLEREHQEIVGRQSASESLTDDGRAMIEEVERTSRAARARLDRLIEATEQAADILRG